MKYMFLHEYPHGRKTLESGECVYCGAPGANKEVDFILAESPLTTFADSDGDELSWSFNLLEAYKQVDLILISIPKEFLDGDGKGYIIELQEFAEDCGYNALQVVSTNFPYFGGCLEGESVYLICSRDPIPVPKSLNTVRTKANSVFPEIITHAKLNPDNIAFVNGAGSLHGFLRSNKSPFPELADWRGAFLMVERRDGDTLRISRLAKEEVGDIYGVTVTSDADMEYLKSVVPNSVHDFFLSKFIL